MKHLIKDLLIMLKVGYIISLFRIPHKIIERNNQMSEYILETKNLVKNFGNFTAIDNVDLKVKNNLFMV